VTAVLPEDLAPEVWAFEEDLGSLGFLFEPFGPDAMRVTAAPETAADPETAFLAALHALAGGEDLAKALACKGSTKFGESLSREGMAALLDEWASCDFPKTCPPN
jgi:DNA mismatch repair protein MutL